MGDDPAATAHRVTPRLWLGGYLWAADPRNLREAGITSVVKMFADDHSYPGGAPRHPGVKYLVVPAEDVPSYDIRPGLLRAVQFIRDAHARGETVLVHCHMGISRSSSVVLLWLLLTRPYTTTLDQELAGLRRIRGVVNPNPGFMAHLRATDSRLRALRRRQRTPQPPQDAAAI